MSKPINGITERKFFLQALLECYSVELFQLALCKDVTPLDEALNTPGFSLDYQRKLQGDP